MGELESLKIERDGPRRRRRWRPGRWIALAIALLALWLFRAPLKAGLDGLRFPEVRALAVRATGGEALAAESGTAANGYIVAAVRAALSADTPGRIVEMNVSEGSVVKRGDVVARLYADEYEADVARAEADLGAAEAAVERALAERAATEATRPGLEAELAAARSELEATRATERVGELEFQRAEELAEVEVQSRQLLDRAQAERDRARAARAAAEGRERVTAAALDQLAARLAALDAAVTQARASVAVAGAASERARATLDKTFVRAPFDGVVVLKDAEVGEVVSPNAVGSQSRGSVVTMVDFDSLEVQVELPETSLGAVSVGAPVRVFLDAFPEAPYAGRVDRIWPTANRQKATVEVRVAFEAPDERLRPEMGVRAVFLDPALASGAELDEPAILLPREALTERGGRPGVFVIQREPGQAEEGEQTGKGVVRFRALALEPSAAEEPAARVPVRDGLAEGEEVVLDPPTSLEDGQRVLVSG